MGGKRKKCTGRSELLWDKNSYRGNQDPRSGYKPVQQSRGPFFSVKERAGRKAKLPSTLPISNPTPPITLGPEDGKKTKPEGPSGPLGAPGLGRRKSQKAPVAPWGLQGQWKVKGSGEVCWPVSFLICQVLSCAASL